MKTDFLISPMGLENQKPTFSWQIDVCGYDLVQEYCQVLVASSPDKLSENRADIWNSGKVKRDACSLEYEGSQLESQSIYYWTVKVWLNKGHPSEWSVPSRFEMGLMTAGNWKEAVWISMSSDKRTSEYRFRDYKTQRMNSSKTVTSNPAGYFRKEFQSMGKIESARAYICGLGYYELYVNGEKVSKSVLDPAPTSYDHHSLYAVHDISDFIMNTNTIGVILGNGFYGQNIAFTGTLDYGKPAFKLLVAIKYKNGQTIRIVSDEHWKCSTGPIVFDNVYAGETYDARFELPGWDRSDYNDSGWDHAIRVQPEINDIRSQVMPPIRKIKELQPVDIFLGENGNWIVDFGQNIAGWIKILLNEKRGTVVSIRTAEALYRKRSAIHQGSLGAFATGVNQEDVYICKGNEAVTKGKEIYEPRFTYHGFRYAEIEGLTQKPEKNSVKAVLVHNDVRSAGSFSCSDPLLNKMYETSKWTVVDNLHGFPEDCPHREKCGWLGDAHATAQFCLYNYDLNQFYKKYMEDIRSQIGVRDPDVPTMVAPGKRTAGPAKLDWGIAVIYLPWYVYVHTGDISHAREYYPEMKKFIKRMLTYKNEKGIIENGMGDWCPPRWDRYSNPDAMECHPFVSANAYFYDGLKIMQQLAHEMGDTIYSRFAKSEAEQLKSSFHNEYFHTSGNRTRWFGSQTGTVMALQFGMVPEENIPEVLESLKYDISVNHNGHHSTGIHGNRYLYTVLCNYKEEALSYNLLTHPDFPSQAYIINCGLTTWPERQWEWNSGIEWDRSLNHPMQGGFAAFFHETVVGIRPIKESPGFKEFIIKPHLTGLLQFAKGSVESSYGTISSEWESANGQFTLKVHIPVSCSAQVEIPFGNKTQLTIQGRDSSFVSERLIRKNNRSAVLKLGSGNYTLIAQN